MTDIEYNSQYHQLDPTEEEVANYTRQVRNLSNKELLEECFYFAGGDDYDGCHTRHGLVVWNLLSEEFKQRLISCGYWEN